MVAMYESRPVVLGLRIAQAILAVIVLGLTAYVVNWWSGYWHAFSPSQINYLVFCAVWTLLALVFLVIFPWKFSESTSSSKIVSLLHKFGILIAEGLTMLFWFAGFVAAAVFLSDRVCFGSVCSAAKAATVFAAFAWSTFAFTTALAALRLLQSRHHSSHHHSKADPKFNVADGV